MAAVDWVDWENGDGLRLRRPANWKAQPAKTPGWVQLIGTRSDWMTIGPVLVQGSLDEVSAGQLLLSLADEAAGEGVGWSEPARAGAYSLQIAGSGDGDLTALASLHWAPIEANTAATFVIVAGSLEGIRNEAPILRQVLQSVALRGPAALPPSADIPAATDFVSWSDPMESAFTVEVPANWSVSGGSFRNSAVDVRQAVVATSPMGRR